MAELVATVLGAPVPRAGGLDRGTALLAFAAVALAALLINLVVRPHLRRRERRRRAYGPDDVHRDAVAWNHGVGGPWRRRPRSQLHDGSGSGPGTPDPDGSDVGPREDERGGSGPLLR